MNNTKNATEPLTSSDGLGRCWFMECSGKDDLRLVQVRIPMAVNRYHKDHRLLCKGCRTAMRGEWRYVKRPNDKLSEPGAKT